MRLFGTLFVLTLTFSTGFAMPRVGDKAVYEMTITPLKPEPPVTEVSQGTYEMELTTFNLFMNVFSMRTTTTDNKNQVITSEGMVRRQDLLGDQPPQEFMLECIAKRGTPENLTVPAGHFLTCKRIVDTATVKGATWFGVVPFAIVKQDINMMQTQMNILKVLKSYTLGK